MSLHKLAEVTITVYGLPEHTGTDDELQELSDDATALLEELAPYPTQLAVLLEEYPGLADKININIKVTGLDQ